MNALSLLRVSILGAAITASPQAQDRQPTCIALMVPVVSGVTANAVDVGVAVRDLFASYLTGPSFKTIVLDARLASLAMQEAREKGCALVLTGTLTGKRGGGSGLGKLAGQAAGTASVYVPYAPNTASAIVRGAAVGTAQAVSSIASTIRTKDELTLEYRLQTLDNEARVGPAKQHARAEASGEDILTPIVQRAAEQIVERVGKPSR